MNEKKVLVISYYFPPMGLSGVQRTLKFVKYLPLYGWRPVILTTSSAQFYAFDDSLFNELPENEFKIYRTDSNGSGAQTDSKFKLRKFPSYLIQKIGRAFLQTIYQPDSKKPWLKQAVKKGEEIIRENNIDVIFATAPPFTDFLVAKELSMKFNIPFIVDYRDVWIDNPFHFYATPFHKIYSSNLESDILNKAEKAIVTIRNTKELLLKRHRFLSYNDIDIITHGYDPEDFSEYQHIKPDKDKFTITHSGLFQDDRTPKYFFKAATEFFAIKPEAKKHTVLRFVGIMRKGHSKLIKKYGLEDNTLLTGYLQHNEVIKHLMESDVLWFMLKDNVRSPGKLYEYIGARKPILACLPEGSIRKLVEESESAVITGPADVEGITNALLIFYDQWKNKNLPYPKDLFVEQFNRKHLTGELAKVLTMASEI